MKYLCIIWKDSVGSRIIAWIIITILSSIFWFLTKSEPGTESIGRFHSFSDLEIILISIIVSLLITIIYTIIISIRKKTIHKKYHNLYHKFTGQLIEINEIERKSPNLKKIAIAGIGSVGKTTLIKNFCSNLWPKGPTKKKGAYVINFSNDNYRYSAVLDGSGQSITVQNSLILKANTIIFLIDHTTSEISHKINNERIFQHKSFLEGVMDLLENSNHTPTNFYFLLNKHDTWGNNSETEIEKFKNTFRKIESRFVDKFPAANVFFRDFSNKIQLDVTKLKINLANKI